MPVKFEFQIYEITRNHFSSLKNINAILYYVTYQVVINLICTTNTLFIFTRLPFFYELDFDSFLS